MLRNLSIEPRFLTQEVPAYIPASNVFYNSVIIDGDLLSTTMQVAKKRA
jgi:hypothetical protein